MFSHQDIYTNNTFSENGAGVAVMYSRQVTMIRNHFLDNWGVQLMEFYLRIYLTAMPLTMNFPAIRLPSTWKDPAG